MSYRFQSENSETAWLPSQGDRDRKMQLLKSFTFFQSQGQDWVAPAGHVIDGASIPRALWSLVGSPYCGFYRRASIVHDWACDTAKNAGDRRRADRMFYDACRAGGCTPFQAMILYLGVRIGAWSSLGKLAKEDDLPTLGLGPAAAARTSDVAQFQMIGSDLPQDPPDDAEAVEQLVEAARNRYVARLRLLADASDVL